MRPDEWSCRSPNGVFWQTGQRTNRKVGMKKYIHINQHVIRRNASNGYNEPVITVKTYKSNNYGHEVTVNGPCKVVYSPDKPLSCGAKVWIETESGVQVLDRSPAGSTKEVAWAGVLASRWRRSSSGTGDGFGPRVRATSIKQQAASIKRQAWQEIII